MIPLICISTMPALAQDEANLALPGCKNYVETIDNRSSNIFGRLSLVDVVLKATKMGECIGIVESMSYMFFMLRKDHCRLSQRE
jgi:hypothetical protein